MRRMLLIRALATIVVAAGGSVLLTPRPAHAAVPTCNADQVDECNQACESFGNNGGFCTPDDVFEYQCTCY